MAGQNEKTQHFLHRPRVFIISDISNEPDDAESLVRYLLYSNQFDTRGLVACTSTWMKTKTCPQDMRKIVQAYAKVVNNLNAHVHPQNPYPSAQYFLDMITTGPSMYGKEALEPHVPLSDGSKRLISAVDESDEPLWLLCWGGTNVLAQMLQETAKRSDSTTLRSKLRVYAISDQDDTGAWIRLNFPDVWYMNSVHGWNQYGLAAWTGISGDKYYGFDQGGPDFTKMTKQWIKNNIQIGPLGTAYPDYLFVPEGDTPTFLYLIQNGLGSPEHPDWGSWGGRYAQLDKVTTCRHYHDAVDHAIGLDGRKYRSNHAAIWRWRDAFQNDFAARMQWTLSGDFKTANHAPVVDVNDSSGPEPLLVEVEAGEDLVLDASKTYDPDGDDLSFDWFHYKEPTATQWWVDAEVTNVKFEKQDGVGKVVKVRLPPPEKCAVDMFTRKPKEKGQQLHFVLTVKDSGTPPLVSYKRVVVQVTNKDLRGGSGQGFESIEDAMADLMKELE